MDINNLVLWIMALLLIITAITSHWGPKWWLWISIASGFLLGLVFGVSLYNYPNGLFQGIVFGAFISIAFVASGGISRYYRRKGRGILKKINQVDQIRYNETTIPTLEAEEVLVWKGFAKHFKGIDAVGGQLVLTNKRIVFKAHPLNLQKYEISFLLTNISESKPYTIQWIFRSGLKIMMKNGYAERFRVMDNIQWSEKIMGIVLEDR